MKTDFLFALRSLRRAPAFFCLAVATLGLGIAANTAIFSVVNAVLLRPLPYEHAERLVRGLLQCGAVRVGEPQVHQRQVAHVLGEKGQAVRSGEHYIHRKIDPEHLRDPGEPGVPEKPLLNHLAVLVDSADEHIAAANDLGIEIDDIKDAPNTYAVFLRGPEGVRIEYVEHKPTFSLT